MEGFDLDDTSCLDDDDLLGDPSHSDKDKENVRPADRKANIFARNHADGDDKFEIPASSTGVEWKKPLEPRSSPSHGGPKHIPSMRNPSLPSNEYRDMYSSPVVQGSRKRPLEPIRGGTSGNRRRRIPGPAGEIEASTRTEPSVDGQRYPDFKSKWDFHGLTDSTHPDRDFLGRAWRQMCSLLGIEPPPKCGEYKPMGRFFQHNISTILRSGSRCKRIPYLIAFVKKISLCSGSALAVLKDPTGKIYGSIHGQVLNEFPQLSVGCVVILRETSIFIPDRKSHYLNVTLENIVHIFKPARSYTSKLPAAIEQFKSSIHSQPPSNPHNPSLRQNQKCSSYNRSTGGPKNRFTSSSVAVRREDYKNNNFHADGNHHAIHKSMSSASNGGKSLDTACGPSRQGGKVEVREELAEDGLLDDFGELDEDIFGDDDLIAASIKSSPRISLPRFPGSL